MRARSLAGKRARETECSLFTEPGGKKETSLVRSINDRIEEPGICLKNRLGFPDARVAETFSRTHIRAYVTFIGEAERVFQLR